MNQSWHRHVTVLTTRVSHFIWIFPSFLDPWNDLPTNRAVGIDWIDQIKVMRRDRHGQFIATQQYSRALFITEDQMFFKLSESRDAIPQLPSRGIPII